MSNKSRLYLIVLYVWFWAGGFAQTAPVQSYTIGPPSAWVKDRPLQPATALPHVAGGQNFLLLDRQINVGEESTYHRRAYQITNETGREDGAQVYIYFDPSYEELKIHHLRLTRRGETYDRLDAGKIQVLQQERELDRLLYNGQRSAFVILDDVRIGDTIDVAYTLHGRNPVFDGRFVDVAPFGWGVPVQNQHLRILAPLDRTIHHQIQGELQLRANTTKHGDLIETEWSMQDMPAIEAEDSIPATTVIYPFIELTEFNSWRDVVQWALPLYAIESITDPLVEAEVQSIRARKLDPQATIIAALDFVQQEVRYLGIEMGPNSHQPSEPGEVIRRRFGDCKDKARLLATILTKLGIKASPMLVHSTRHKNLHQWLPSPYAFDHVIVSVDLGQNRWYLDPTLTYQRGANPGLRSVGLYGPYLNIRPETTALEDAPLGSADTYLSKVEEVIDLADFDAKAAYTVKTTSMGASANYLRAYIASRSREQLGREYLEYFTTYYAGIASAAPIEIRDDTQNNIIYITERYTIANLFKPADASGTRVADIYAPAVESYLRAPNLNQRRHPYALSHPVTVDNDIELNLPDDWPVTKSSETVSDPSFTFQQSDEGKNRQFKLHYWWESHTPAVEVDRIAEFSENLGKARALLGYQLTYNPALAGGTGITPNWVMISFAIMVFIMAGFGSVVLVRQRNPIPPRLEQTLEAKTQDPYAYTRWRNNDAPHGLGGWLILVAIGLVMQPFYLIGLLISGASAYFDINVWHALTTPENPAHQPNYSWVAPFEIGLNVTLLVFSITLVIMFFRRSFLFPRAFQIMLSANVAVAIYNVASTQLFHSIGTEDQMESWSTLLRSVSSAAIWIPYFFVSRRVKKTFVQ